MSKLQMRIIKRAVKNRLSDGESFDDIIKSYPKLTESEIAEIRAELDIDKVKESEV